jgi:hypothetical protein
MIRQKRPEDTLIIGLKSKKIDVVSIDTASVAGIVFGPNAANSASP